MKSVRLILGSLSPAVLLLPFLASADSSVQTGGKGARLTATAHVNIQVVIPLALSLAVPSDTGAAAGVRTVSIESNTQNATVGSTQGALGESRGRVILSAAAGRSIAQEAVCSATGVGVVCTASSP